MSRLQALIYSIFAVVLVVLWVLTIVQDSGFVTTAALTLVWAVGIWLGVQHSRQHQR